MKSHKISDYFQASIATVYEILKYMPQISSIFLVTNALKVNWKPQEVGLIWTEHISTEQ